MAPLLQVVDLVKHFPVRRRWLVPPAMVRAVDGVNFEIEAGETMGLVGESGSGKTTIGQLIVRLAEPTAGRILVDGRDVTGLRGKAAKAFTREVQIVFQDPYSSLNPHRTVAQTLVRPFRVHRIAEGGAVLRRRILEVLADVGLSPPERYVDRYPHEMSGGERQRVAIARAVALRPKLVVADEAVSSLDVSIRAQLLNLLKDLQEKYRLAYLFITHDLATLRSVSHRVAVMYLGRLVEIGPTEEVILRPRHPYTRALLGAIPIPDPLLARKRTTVELQGPMPSPLAPPPGCRFHTRCPEAREVCRVNDPLPIVTGVHRVHCLPEVVEHALRIPDPATA